MDTAHIYRNLGIRIRELRKSLRQTQDQLAKQVGISRASLANIEAGRQQVLVHHLFALASALQLDSPAQLLLTPQARSRSSAASSSSSSLPLAEGGLTEKQRREVLSLMGDAMQQVTSNGGREDA
jgi:transcriptional regulator with XRE-family HTH domain